MSSNITWDLGSFRDPAGAVFFAEGAVYRSVSEEAKTEVNKLLEAPFFQALMQKGNIVQSQLIKNTFNVPGEMILHHEHIPFISYPFEWSFGMLKEAALLTLKLLTLAIQNGFILKDGTAWNLTYFQGKMVFFDVLSFETYIEGQAWDGYQQFCHEFLYPLLLKAHKNIHFQDYFKGTLRGVDVQLMDKIFGLKDIFKTGVFKYVILNAILTGSKKVNASTINRKYKLSKMALLGLVMDLSKIVQQLECATDHSVWIDYATNNTYKNQDESDKIAFVQRFLSVLPEGSKVVDLGCNTGKYAFMASERHQVIACDLDADCIEAIYQKAAQTKNTAITPVVLNLMNPSANVGWGLVERKSIYERLKVNGFLSLALIHHICIANNVPLTHFVQFLAQLGSCGVLEWVEKSDPMVQFLLRNRKDIFNHYDWDNFAACVTQYFNIKEVITVNEGMRKLCWLEKKS